MIEFTCKDCDVTVYSFVVDKIPDPPLCLGCKLINEAAEQDRPTLRRILRKSEKTT